jgi:site-specific recombinase XerD
VAPSAAYAPTLERWLQRLANAGRSARTVAAYRNDLDDTMTTVAGLAGHRLLPDRRSLEQLAPDEREAAVLRAFDELDLTTVSFDDLDEAIAEFRTRPDPRFTTNPQRAPEERAPATIARRTAAIRTFFAWCYSTDRIPADPAAKLEAPKRRKRMPKALDGKMAAAALDQSGQGSRWPERDELIVALALACGLRLEEIATLRLDQIQGDPPEALVVRGKGDKERRLGVPPVVQEALAAYLPTRDERLAELRLDARTVVISSRPRPVKNRAGEVIGATVESSRESVAYVVDRLLRRVGARQAQIRVHAVRHTFATLGLREGAFSLRQLQVALGHASLATTQIYTEVADEEIAAAMQLHPLSGRGGSRQTL